MFQTKVVEKIKAHILFCKLFFNYAVYEICGKILEPDKLQMTMWCNCIAYGIPKATNTYLEYVILIAFSTATVVL
jgi:hypothetical protein